jgi:hypothetical protein
LLGEFAVSLAPQTSGDAAGNWIPESPAAVIFAINRYLSEGNPDFATVVLISEVLKGRFSVVVSLLAGRTGIDEHGIKLLLSSRTADSVATRIAFALAGLSDSLYPLFSACIDLVQEAVRVTKMSITAHATEVLLEKILASSEIQALSLREDIVRLLKRHAGVQPPPPPPGIVPIDNPAVPHNPTT